MEHIAPVVQLVQVSDLGVMILGIIAVCLLVTVTSLLMMGHK